MEIPEGLKHLYPDHLVCKLKKAIYELQQASRAWCIRIESFLINQGFPEEQLRSQFSHVF
jgi:hypothetical protein